MLYDCSLHLFIVISSVQVRMSGQHNSQELESNERSGLFFLFYAILVSNNTFLKLNI